MKKTRIVLLVVASLVVLTLSGCDAILEGFFPEFVEEFDGNLADQSAGQGDDFDFATWGSEADPIFLEPDSYDPDLWGEYVQDGGAKWFYFQPSNFTTYRVELFDFVGDQDFTVYGSNSFPYDVDAADSIGGSYGTGPFEDDEVNSGSYDYVYVKVYSFRDASGFTVLVDPL